jgi:hypothetical protein
LASLDMLSLDIVSWDIVSFFMLSSFGPVVFGLEIAVPQTLELRPKEAIERSLVFSWRVPLSDDECFLEHWPSKWTYWRSHSY